LEKIAFLISKWIINMRLNKVKIGFLGGEPLLHIDKLEFFIRTLNKKLGAFRDKVIYSLQTNCVNISEKVIEFISEKQIKLGVSLDGPKEIHDKARIFPNGRGSYQLIVKNLKLLQQHELRPGIITIIHRYNWDRATEIIDHLLKIGIRKFRANPVIPVKKEETEYNISPIQYFQTMKQIYHEMTRKPIVEKNTINYLMLLKRQRTNICHEIPCGAGYNMLVFNSDKNIYPCDYLVLDDFKIANIDDIEDLTELRATNVFQKLEKRSIILSKTCSKCSLSELCSRGCLARTFLATKNMYEIDKWYCEFFRKYISFLKEKIRLSNDN